MRIVVGAARAPGRSDPMTAVVVRVVRLYQRILPTGGDAVALVPAGVVRVDGRRITVDHDPAVPTVLDVVRRDRVVLRLLLVVLLYPDARRVEVRHVVLDHAVA